MKKLLNKDIPPVRSERWEMNIMSFPPPTTASPAATPSGSSYYGYPTPFTYSSYQWPYTYGYVPTAPQTPARPPVTAAQQPTVQPRTSTIQPYTPAYVRETSTPTPSAATTHAPGRSARKSTNLKGLFSKERMYPIHDSYSEAETLCFQSRVLCTGLVMIEILQTTLSMYWRKS